MVVFYFLRSMRCRPCPFQHYQLFLAPVFLLLPFLVIFFSLLLLFVFSSLLLLTFFCKPPLQSFSPLPFLTFLDADVLLPQCAHFPPKSFFGARPRLLLGVSFQLVLPLLASSVVGACALLVAFFVPPQLLFV